MLCMKNKVSFIRDPKSCAILDFYKLELNYENLYIFWKYFWLIFFQEMDVLDLNYKWVL